MYVCWMCAYIWMQSVPTSLSFNLAPLSLLVLSLDTTGEWLYMILYRTPHIQGYCVCSRLYNFVWFLLWWWRWWCDRHTHSALLSQLHYAITFLLTIMILQPLPFPLSWSSHSLWKSRQINVTGGEKTICSRTTHLVFSSSQLADWDCQEQTTIGRADTPSALFPWRHSYWWKSAR